MFQCHVEHDHRRALGERIPIDRIRHLARGVMAGHEGDRGIDLAVRHRDAGISQATDARRNAGHDAEGNASLDQAQSFLAATAEDEGIAAFQAQDPFSFPRQLHEAERDVRLLR